jgi:hypothetical protein
MRSGLTEAYHNPRRRNLQSAGNTTAVLATAGDQELSDAHPTESKRRTLKRIGRSLRRRLSPVELMYLAAVLEVEANDARRAEAS